MILSIKDVAVKDAFFDDLGSRIYDTPAGYCASVTSIIGKLSTGKQYALRNWEKKLGIEEANLQRRLSLSRGEQLHKVVENYLEGQDYKNLIQNYDVYNCFKAVQPYLDSITEIIAVEAPIFHPQYKYAGRIDIIASIDGMPTIIDLKTANKLKEKKYIKDYYLQVSAYAGAYNKIIETNDKIRDCQILVAISGNPEPQIFKMTNDQIKTNFAEFINMTKQYYIKYPMIKKDGKLIKQIRSGPTIN